MLWSLAPYWPLIAALLGALFGSFSNVVIHRLPRRESLAWPSSHCPHCSYPIPPHQNVPILSYLFLRGRCASCQEPISPRYPIVEGVTAAGCALAALLFPLHQGYLSLIFLAVVPLAVISVAMWLDGNLPDPRITLPLMFGACAYVVLGQPLGSLQELAPVGAFGVLAGAGLTIITRIRPPWGVIGFGSAVGLLLGPWSLPLLAAAIWQFRLRPALAAE